MQRLEDAVKSPPVDISVGSEYHRKSFTVEKLQEMCKKKGLNYHMTLGDDLYRQLFPGTLQSNATTMGEETEEDRQDRMRVHAENKVAFHSWVEKSVKDKLSQQLFYNAVVVDTKAFNKRLYRPKSERKGVVSALLQLGSTEDNAESMADRVGIFPASKENVHAAVCKHSCSFCHQHELIDGTQVVGYLPKHKTLGLTEAPWSAWHHASERYGS